MERITLLNPNGHSYRAPIERVEEFRLEANGINVAMFGKIVDKLGQYEDLGLEPKEIEKILQEKKEKGIKKDA